MIFKFLNHAGFSLESKSSILLIDPWMEGSAFNNGWDLLDSSTSNKKIIQYLKKRKKKVFVWISHEHSDHFSISFLKSIKEVDGVKIIYQKTYDNRVRDFLLNNNFEVINPKSGKEFKIDNSTSITTWPYRGGDSLSLINFYGKSILNINDCEINSLDDSKKLLSLLNKKTSKIDFLMTQFGYACWNGNENEIEKRKKAAMDKLQSMENQIKVLRPSFVIPFASFVYFSNEMNFYINDQQNKISSIKNHEFLGKLKNIYFLKPLDQFNITNVKEDDLRKKSEVAEEHYNLLYQKIKPIRVADENKLNEKEILDISTNYLNKINQSFPLLFKIKKLDIKILLTDINQVLHLNYSKKPKLDSDSNFDLKMTSQILNFILNNLYGFNTIHVSGVFRTYNDKSIDKAESFFWRQSLLKFGYGITKPILTIIFFLKSKFGMSNQLF
jgi:DNA-binding transcriptional MerR regulator